MTLARDAPECHPEVLPSAVPARSAPLRLTSAQLALCLALLGRWCHILCFFITNEVRCLCHPPTPGLCGSRGLQNWSQQRWVFWSPASAAWGGRGMGGWAEKAQGGTLPGLAQRRGLAGREFQPGQSPQPRGIQGGLGVNLAALLCWPAMSPTARGGLGLQRDALGRGGPLTSWGLGKVRSLGRGP